MTFYGVELSSRLLLGTARYPSPKVLVDAIKASEAEVVTVSLRREAGSERGGQGFWSIIRALGVRVLPNTAGCHSVKEAVTTAHMARELFDTPWIKLEVIRDDETLQPDVFGLVEAAKVLNEEGFEVFPYTTEDLAVLGYDAVLLNTAVAEAGDPVAMAKAFALAIEAGRMAFAARPLEPRDMAAPSTPVFGKAALGG